MRSIVRQAMLLAGALLAACEADQINGPSRPGAGPLFERGGAGSKGAFTFTTIDVPGALLTVAYGINARGDVVGTYVDATNHQHGFVRRDDDVTTIDYPNAAGTEARGISPNGEIVGDYWLLGEPAVNVHGYRLTKHGEFVPVNYPGHTNTIAQRILPDGTILGCRHDENMSSTMRGVVITRSDSVEISAFASMNNGATPDHRRIVGLYTNTTAIPARQEGFLIDDGAFTPLVVPGSLSTAAWDMNPSGDIVGVYRNAAGVHGFALESGGYVSVDVPGATATRAFGINARGNVVGSYVSNGQTHAFLTRLTHEDDR